MEQQKQKGMVDEKNARTTALQEPGERAPPRKGGSKDLGGERATDDGGAFA